MDWNQIQEIIEDRPFVDVFLLCVDRDGDENRRQALDHLEQRAASLLPDERCFLAENAWQELEVWVLAGHDLPSDWVWQEVRQEVNPKEEYYLPFAAQQGFAADPTDGRRTLGLEAARRYRRIRQLCSEDVASLEDRLREQLGG